MQHELRNACNLRKPLRIRVPQLLDARVDAESSLPVRQFLGEETLSGQADMQADTQARNAMRLR